MRPLSSLLPSPKDLTVEQAARLARVHAQTVRRWVLEDGLRAYRWGRGGRVMIKRAEFAKFLRGRQVQGPLARKPVPVLSLCRSGYVRRGACPAVRSQAPRIRQRKDESDKDFAGRLDAFREEAYARLHRPLKVRGSRVTRSR